jgi:hypothetical protein
MIFNIFQNLNKKKIKHNTSNADFDIKNFISSINQQKIKVREFSPITKDEHEFLAKVNMAKDLLNNLRALDLKYTNDDFSFDIEQLDNILNSTYDEALNLLSFNIIYPDIITIFTEQVDDIISISNDLKSALLISEKKFINNKADVFLDEVE